MLQKNVFNGEAQSGIFHGALFCEDYQATKQSSE
jgi:hypothetical protein